MYSFVDCVSEVSRNTNKVSKKSKYDKYSNIFQVEFDEMEPYQFLNDTKVDYNYKQQLCLNNFMLVYKTHIEYRHIQDFIEKKINSRIKRGNDEIIYWMGLHRIEGYGEEIYKRTYVYLKLENYYKTTRSTFNLKINDVEYVPCIRIIERDRLLDTMKFIYTNPSNIPYPDDVREFNNRKNIYGIDKREISQEKKIRKSKKINDLGDESTLPSTITDTSYLPKTYLTKNEVINDIKNEIKIELENRVMGNDKSDLLISINRDNNIIKTDMHEIKDEMEELRTGFNDNFIGLNVGFNEIKSNLEENIYKVNSKINTVSSNVHKVSKEINANLNKISEEISSVTTKVTSDVKENIIKIKNDVEENNTKINELKTENQHLKESIQQLTQMMNKILLTQNSTN